MNTSMSSIQGNSSSIFNIVISPHDTGEGNYNINSTYERLLLSMSLGSTKQVSIYQASRETGNTGNVYANNNIFGAYTSVPATISGSLKCYCSKYNNGTYYYIQMGTYSALKFKPPRISYSDEKFHTISLPASTVTLPSNCVVPDVQVYPYQDDTAYIDKIVLTIRV